MLEDGQEPEVPTHYLVGRHIRDADAVQAVLRMTPVDAAVVSDIHDHDFASSLFRVVILVSPGREMEMRKELGRPVVIFGDADFVDAVYADGRRESLAAHA